MGRSREEIRITYSVSRHNDAQDQIDDILAECLRDVIKAICASDVFESIRPDVL